MTEKKRMLAPPSPDRAPLRTNVFEYARNTATTLAPLFPYFDEGSIVPCLSVFRGGPGRHYGRFQHFNTVDEVIMMFGSPGGMVFVGPKLHPVGAPFRDPADPESSAIALITQRQQRGKPHREEYRFLCDECDRRLTAFSFDATPAKRGAPRDPVGLFATIVEGYRVAQQHNEDEDNLRCPHCGHINEPFPVEAWGWDVYAEQGSVAIRKRKATRRASEPREEQNADGKAGDAT